MSENIPLTSDNKTMKKWGYEELLYNGLYCVKNLVYTKPGIASSLHYHTKKQETFLITRGAFRIDLVLVDPVTGGVKEGGTSELFSEGDSITLPPYVAHQVRCLKHGVIVECSTQDDPDDCVRLLPSEG